MICAALASIATPCRVDDDDLRERADVGRCHAGGARSRGDPGGDDEAGVDECPGDRRTRDRDASRRDEPRGQRLGAARPDELDHAPRARTRLQSAARMATFVANSVVCGAISSVASRPTPTA